MGSSGATEGVLGTSIGRMARAKSPVASRDLLGRAVAQDGTLHIEQALEYNQDPGYLAELLVHRLTIEARRRVGDCGLSRRDLARRLETSVPQLYRLLDPANTSKSLSQLVSLLHVLGCDVELVVTSRSAA